MLNVQLDQERAEQIYRELAAKKIAELQDETVFWDMADLEKHARMTVNTMKQKFFYDEDFPKFKSDSRWRFPAKECRAYLENWWQTQPRS